MSSKTTIFLFIIVLSLYCLDQNIDTNTRNITEKWSKICSHSNYATNDKRSIQHTPYNADKAKGASK